MLHTPVMSAIVGDVSTDELYAEFVVIGLDVEEYIEDVVIEQHHFLDKFIVNFLLY